MGILPNKIAMIWDIPFHEIYALDYWNQNISHTTAGENASKKLKSLEFYAEQDFINRIYKKGSHLYPNLQKIYKKLKKQAR